MPDMEHMGYTSPGGKTQQKHKEWLFVLGETIFINFLSQWCHVEQNLSSNVRSGLEESHNEHLVDDEKVTFKKSTNHWKRLVQVMSTHFFSKVPVYEIIQNPISFM